MWKVVGTLLILRPSQMDDPYRALFFCLATWKVDGALLIFRPSRIVFSDAWLELEVSGDPPYSHLCPEAGAESYCVLRDDSVVAL